MKYVFYLKICNYKFTRYNLRVIYSDLNGTQPLCLYGQSLGSERPADDSIFFFILAVKYFIINTFLLINDLSAIQEFNCLFVWSVK